MKVIIAGCGFLGEAAAALFLKDGWDVLGLCATSESAGRLKGSGFTVLAMDIAGDPSFEERWFAPDVLVHCASSGGGGVEGYDRVYRMGLERLLAAALPKRIIFTGSTSVYGQTDGSLVDETSETNPPAETGKILLEAERIALAQGGVVLRFSGLYGPGRSVLLRKYRSGDAVLEDGGLRWINQIHRDDAAAAVVKAASLPLGIYNATDDTPATQREVYEWIAEHLNGPLPPIGISPRQRKRGSTNKRVSNAKLRATGWAPRFPSYREALPSL